MEVKEFMDYIKNNSEAWDRRAENDHIWSIPVSSETIELARKGIWDIVLTPTKKVPPSWFPDSILNKKILCLASGGGQQGPIIAALGADVTVFDNSKKQLEKDEFVAYRDNLSIRTVQGDMRDLSIFSDESFDFIVHPWSNAFVDSVLPVWKEASRVLMRGGVMISGFANPLEYIFDSKKLDKGEFVIRHKIPYSDITSLTEEEFELTKDEGIHFGHTLTDQIQGQIEAGLMIVGFYEDIGGTVLDNYIYTSIATKSVKI